MSPDTVFSSILDLDGVTGYALVSSEDGSTIEAGGITPGNIDEMVAFIGSAAEIITDSCGLEEIVSIRGIGVRNIIIVPFRGNYVGFSIGKDKRNLEEEILEKLEDIEEEGEDNRVYKLLNIKASQLNMLLDEFIKGSDKEMWTDYVSKGINALDKEGKFSRAIELDGIRIETLSAEGLTLEEVNKFMKLLLDFIVKKAINELGSKEAKKCVRKVIKKLGKSGD